MKRWLSLVAQLAPIIAVAAGLPPQVGSLIATGIVEAAAIKGSSGPEKNAHVVALVNKSLTATGAIGAATGQPNLSKTISTIVDMAKALDVAHPAAA